MARFIHSADWQLGMTRHFLSEEAQGRFTQDRIDGIRRIGELARQHAAEFVLVAGDVFESNQVERQTVVRALDAMSAIPVPVLLLPGNHDPLDAISVYRSRTFREKQPENVIVLESGEPLEPPGTRGVEVVGAPWESKRPLCDLVAGACADLAPHPNGVRICLGHGAVDRLAPDPEHPARIRLQAAERAIAEGRIHYLALGDRHSVTRVGESGAVWYSGAHLATDFVEEKPGFVLLVELEPGATPRVTELPVGTWTFVELRFELLRPEDLDDLQRWLEDREGKERTVLRLALVGTLSLASKARLDGLLEDYADHFASLRLWERASELAVVPDALDAEPLGLAGYARETWDELAERARRPDADGRTAIDALALLYRLAGGGTS